MFRSSVARALASVGRFHSGKKKEATEEKTKNVFGTSSSSVSRRQKSAVLVCARRRCDDDARMKKTPGEKGACLVAMTNLGLRVPPGAMPSVSVCKDYLQKGPEVLKELNELMFETADVIGEEVSKVFWRKSTNFVGEELALLLSVSSGAEASVPVLNLGLNDRVTDASTQTVLTDASKKPWFLYDAYRRLLVLFGGAVFEIQQEHFEKKSGKSKELKCVQNDVELNADDLHSLCEDKRSREVEKRSKKFFTKKIRASRHNKIQKRMSQSYSTPIQFLAQSPLSVYLRDRKELAVKAEERGEPTRGSQVSILSTNHTTSDAMKRIGELAVQALPVVKMHPSNQMYEPQNFMAAGDLVDALVAKVDACPDFDVQGGDQSRRCAALARLGREFAQLRLDSIPSRFDGTVIYENQSDKNLAQTINDCFLISPKSKPGDGELLQAVHRFAVQTTESNKITEIVCQSDLVMYLHTNRSLIYPEFMGASLADLGLGRSALSRRVEGATASDQKTVSSYGIVSVTSSTTCIDAFRVMRNNSVSAVAIVSEKEGKLLGAFSETDISYFADPDFAMALGLSVSQFLFLRHNASPKITHGVFAGADAFDAALQNALYDSWRVYCKLEDKLEDVLELMSTGAVHRIWVVDDERKPIGCVSLVDILALFQQWESPEEQKLSSKKTKEEELTSQFEKTTASELKERVVTVAGGEVQMQE